MATIAGIAEARRVLADRGRAGTVREQLDRTRPEPGDVLLFYQPERWRGRLISQFTRSPYYHVALYAGNGCVVEARIPCVVRRDLTDLDGCRFVVLRAPTREAGRRALAWAEARIDEPYDLWGVAAAALARLSPRSLAPLWCRFCRAGRYVCGGFVARAFSVGAGVALLPGSGVADSLLVPADFASLVPEAEVADRGTPVVIQEKRWRGTAIWR